MTFLRPRVQRRLQFSGLRLAALTPGALGDFRIIDELGREVWASMWVRAVYLATRPRVILRTARWG